MYYMKNWGCRPKRPTAWRPRAGRCMSVHLILKQVLKTQNVTPNGLYENLGLQAKLTDTFGMLAPIGEEIFIYFKYFIVIFKFKS